MAAAGSILGNAVQRLEDPTLLTGAGKYLDDMAPSGALHVAFVRSSQAYAKVIGVDISEAQAMPGVKAVYHARGDDLGIPSFQGFPMMPPVLNRPVFANDVVRFVGDIVAAVVATSKAAGDRRCRGGDRRLRADAGDRHPRTGSDARCGDPVPRARVERVLRHRARCRRRPVRGRRRDRRGHHGQSAIGRCSDGEQRDPRRAR